MCISKITDEHQVVPVPTEELRLLREENERLRNYALMDANCPCCQCDDVCEEECTFADDCPDEYPRMAAARQAIAKAES